MVAAILNWKKCTRGIFGASSEFVWGDVQVSFLRKSVFCNFIPGFCVFFTNALALWFIFITLDSEKHHSIVWLYSSMNVVVCLLKLVIWVVYYLYQKNCSLWYMQFLRWNHVEGSTFIWLLQEISISTVWMTKWTSFLCNWFWLQLTTISFPSFMPCHAMHMLSLVMFYSPFSHIVFFPPFFWQIMYLLKSFSIEDWLVFIEDNSISGSLFKSCWSIADSVDLQQKRI